MNYFIADLHFGHKNCLAFDNRPFNTIEEHDEYIIKTWNETVTNEDDVYILGDISWHKVDKTIEIFKQLKGKKHLIRGNHDDHFLKSSELKRLFVDIRNYEEIASGDGKSIVLCHYPMPCFRNHFYGWYHLYGHVHNSFEWNMMENTKRQMTALYDKECKMYNVGAMMSYIDYKPRTLQEILFQNEDI